MYEAKGFSGKLLDEVVEVLVADDNRLLRVMLEEELGLSLEVYEHPLKQAAGAGLGTLIAATLATLSYFFWPYFGVPLVAFVLIAFSANLTAKLEKRGRVHSAVWNLALTFFAATSAYFLTQLIRL